MRSLFLLSLLVYVCDFVEIQGEIYFKTHQSVPYYHIQPYYQQQYYHYPVAVDNGPPKFIGASIQFTPPTNKFAQNRHLHWFKTLKKIEKKGVKYLTKYLASGCHSPFKLKIIKKYDDLKVKPHLRRTNPMLYGFGKEYFPKRENITNNNSNYSTIYIPLQASTNRTTTNKQIRPIYNSNVDIRRKENSVSGSSTINKSLEVTSSINNKHGDNWTPIKFTENQKGFSS